LEYLDIANEAVGMKMAVAQVYNDRNNHELWEMYLSVKPDKSFYDWKDEIIKQANPVYANAGTRNEKETQNIVQKSKNILKGFIPENK
jgi:hypothetical protein